MNNEEFLAFVRDRASLGWSRSRVCETLGISRARLQNLTQGVDDITWPGVNRGAGHRQHYQAIKGQFPEYLRINVARATQASAQRHNIYDLCGIRSSVSGLCRIWGELMEVSASQVRRRLQAGLSLHDAMFAPETPKHLRKKKGLKAA